MVTRPLPAKFAVPVTMQYDPAQGGARIIGPVTHGRTISLSVSPADGCLVVGTSRADVLAYPALWSVEPAEQESV